MKKTIIICSLFIAISFITRVNAQVVTPYIVLTTVSDTSSGYYHAAKILSDYRNGQIIHFNPANIDSLIFPLQFIAPRYVAIVLKPSELDINFVRKFLMMSTQLDTDPFSDFSYGYITGATAQDAVNFVNNIIYADSHNIQNYPLKIGGYAASSINAVYTVPGDFMSYLNPITYSNIYLETSDSATGKNYFLSHTSYMMNNKMLDIGHNGDAHMLWLFDGGNSTPNPPVWNYDSTKIENPAYGRVGLTSYDIGSLNLFPAVAFNGACHSGEPKKVMVEGDIAATFGDTQGLVKFYNMSDSFSFALSILKTGITGYFAPCGANNANDQGEEVYNAFLYHEPLGDIFKRSIDGVVMGFLGNRPSLSLYVEGASTWDCDILPSGTFDPNDWSGAYYMLGGKANRIYYGDPLFNPYKNDHSDSLNITKTVIDSINSTTLDIKLTYRKPDAATAYFPVWDKFHFSDTRIYTAVELPPYCAEVTGFTVIDSSGPFHMVIHAVEHFLGKTILHIEVDIPNDMYSLINYHMKFLVNYLSTGITQPAQISKRLEVYPNPAGNYASLQFSNPGKEIHQLSIYSANGQIIKKVNDIRDGYIKFDTSKFGSGMYFFQLQNKNGLAGMGKFVVE